MTVQSQESRADKFSFSKHELDALEAGMQLIMSIDGQIAPLRRRIEAQPVVSADPSESWNFQHALLSICDWFKAPDQQLKLLLALVELATAPVYAKWVDDPKKMPEVSPEARLQAMRHFAAASIGNDGGTYARADQLRDAVLAGLEEARSTQSSFWSSALKVIAIAALVALGGVFAGPLIGSLVGTYLLGLSGAAALSAGLALLGGGAIAAGGFGMLGGTVVIAAAFGAAGGSAAQVFLGEGGDEAAKLTAIRMEGAVRAMCALKLIDRDLAHDYQSALRSQKESYEKVIPRNREEGKRAKAVAEALKKALDAVSELLRRATVAGEILNEPIAWSQASQRPSPSNVEDTDFAALLVRHEERCERLRRCTEYLRHAHERYADVKDADFMRSLWETLTQEARCKLLLADADLSLALDEILAIANSAQEEFEEICLVIEKAARMAHQQETLLALQARYRKLALALQHELAAERARSSELSSSIRALEARLALAAIASSAFLRSSRPLLPRDAAAWAPANQQQATEEDLSIAIALSSGVSEQQLAVRGAERGRIDAVREAQLVIGHELGASLDAVRETRKQKLVAIHPDRVIDSSEELREQHVRERAAIELGYELHVLFGRLREKVA